MMYELRPFTLGLMIGCAGACAHAEIFWDVDVGITSDGYLADSGTFTRVGGDTNFPTPPGFSTVDLRTEGQYGVALTYGSVRGFGIVTAVSNIDLNALDPSTNAGVLMEYRAGFNDTMTITSPTAANGTQGVVTLAMQIDGVVSGTNQLVDFANQGNLIQVNTANGGVDVFANSSIDSVGAGIDSDDPATINNQLLSIDVPFVFGEEFDFGFLLEFDVRAGNLGPDWGSARADRGDRLWQRRELGRRTHRASRRQRRFGERLELCFGLADGLHPTHHSGPDPMNTVIDRGWSSAVCLIRAANSRTFMVRMLARASFTGRRSDEGGVSPVDCSYFCVCGGCIVGVRRVCD